MIAITPRQTATFTAIGFSLVVVFGVSTCIVLAFALLWCAVQVCLLMLQSAVAALLAIGALYTSADPLIKFCLLICIAYLIYRVYCKVTRRASYAK